MQSVAAAITNDTDEELTTYYLEWTEEAIQELSGLIETIGADAAPETSKRIYEISHNIKGMGTSFGFPLMTEAGRSMCLYLRARNDGTLHRTVLDAHLKSFKIILAKRMMADGGEMGKSLIDRLNQLVEHMLAA